MVKPSPPLRYDEQQDLLDLKELGTIVAGNFAKREEAYDVGNEMQAALTRMRSVIGTPNIVEEMNQFQETYKAILVADPGRTPRDGNLSDRIEEFVRISSYHHFLETGTLLPPVSYATDEEYLAGAVMGLAKELEHYGLGRATVRDIPSVQTACDVTTAMFEFLLQMDFRNGPLRRRFDGTKYSVKALETLLYELSVTSPASANEESKTKRAKLELIPLEDLEGLKARMEARDELRENLIKKSRDGQKAAKQAIFALHRGDTAKAETLLDTCMKCIKDDLLPIVNEEAPLRTQGCFTSVLEEFAEAKLFQVWLHGSTGKQNEASANPNGKILSPQELDAVMDDPHFSPEEYIGGLSDLTGEIGRFAVQRGTARDVDSVRVCLSSNSAILRELQCMGRLPGNTGKKLEAPSSSVRKLERILYELSLSDAAGGRNVQSDVVMEEQE